MRCSKCDTEMFNAKLTANNLYPVILTDKENGIFKLHKKSDVLCCCGKPRRVKGWLIDYYFPPAEIKILIGCTEEEKAIVYETHNETEFMKGVLIRR